MSYHAQSTSNRDGERSAADAREVNLLPEDSPATLSPRQLRIRGLLSHLVGEGPALFFHDACEIMAEDPPRATATHQVGHALREVESALRAVLQTERVSGHRESILAILQDMEMSPSDIDAELWLSIVGQGNARGLHSRAHRPGLDLPRPIDADFRAFVRDFESLLERVLDLFRTFYVEVFRRMDRLLAIESPSVRDAEDLRQRIPANRVSHDHFFRNASAAWIRPLTEVGCFAAPPEPQVAEDGSVSFLRWPQSEYLIRMVNDEPDAVLAAALQVPTTDNSYVMWNLVEIAVALPAEAAVELLPVIMPGIPGRYGLVTADDYGNLVTHFAQAGLAAPALAGVSGLTRS